MSEKYREHNRLPIRMHEAYKFFSKNNFFTYKRGPLRNASPTSRAIIAREKQSTNLEGAITMVPSRRKQSKMKNPAVAKAMPAFM